MSKSLGAPNALPLVVLRPSDRTVISGAKQSRIEVAYPSFRTRMESLSASRAEPLLNTTFAKINKIKKCIVLIGV